MKETLLLIASGGEIGSVASRMFGAGDHNQIVISVICAVLVVPLCRALQRK